MPDAIDTTTEQTANIEPVKISEAITHLQDLDADQFDKTMAILQEWFLTSGMEWTVNIIAALLVFLLGRWITSLVTRIIARMMESRQIDPSLISFTQSLTTAALMAFVIIASLAQLNVQTASFIAVIGAAGLAVGLALQGSLANFASGVLMIIFRPIKVGDYVEAAGTAGIVEDIQIFCTILRTPDNKTIIVPNTSITGETIVNFSSKPTRRIDFEFGVAYNADLKHCREVFQQVLAEDSRILNDPETIIAVKELADSAVIFAVRPWVNSADYWGVYFDIMEKTKIALDAAGIGIPFPQMDVHLHKTNQ